MLCTSISVHVLVCGKKAPPVQVAVAVINTMGCQSLHHMPFVQVHKSIATFRTAI